MSQECSGAPSRAKNPAGITQPLTPWRCFHCDDVFDEFEGAALHFGKFDDCLPACKIGVEAYRKMEDELASWRSESDGASKEFYALGAAHQTALMRAEEQGYERGLSDGRASDRAMDDPEPSTGRRAP